MIQVFINEEVIELPEIISLQVLLEEQVGDTRGMAVAINDSIVARANWDTYFLKNQDNILLIVATQGG